MNIAPSAAMVESITEIMDERVPSIYLVDCAISGPDYDLNVDWFVGVAIARDFAGAFTDYISVSVDLRPRDLLALLEKYQDLTCTITLKPVSTRTFYPYMDRAPILFNGRVIIHNPADIAKKYNLKQLVDDPKEGTPLEERNAMRLRLEFQMMEKETYDLRHKEVNAMFTDTSMDKVLYYVTEQLGLKQSSIAPPDNPDTPKNCIIPPGQDISQVFKFLQDRYGVYAKGMRSYISEGKMHIYPGHDTEPKDYPSVWHVIKAPDGYAPGAEGYHKRDGDDVYLVANAGGDIKNLTAAGVEQSGNSQISLQADRVVDHVSNITEKGVIDIKTNIQNLRLNTEHQAQGDAINARYTGAHVNSYNALSNMSGYDAVLASVVWDAAEPIMANPGQKVIFHYDEDGYYSTATGILEGVAYVSQPADRALDKPFFKFHGSLSMRLKPDPKKQG